MLAILLNTCHTVINSPITISSVVSECYSDGEIRLSNSNTTYLPDGSIVVTGRIEVCANFTYSSVCDYGWDQADARVFCRNHLQSFGIYSNNFSKYLFCVSQQIFCVYHFPFLLPAAVPMGGSTFGYSNAGIAVEDVMCNGSESSLEYCSTSPFNVITVSQCQDETTNSAGVVCTGRGTAYQ